MSDTGLFAQIGKVLTGKTQPSQAGVTGREVPQQQNAGQVQQPQQVQGNPDPNVESQPGDAGLKPAGQQSMNDQFKKLWEDDPNGQQPASGKLFNTDMEAFSKAVDGMDFAQNVDGELVQKALNGDVASLKSLLNGTGRAAFSRATLASSQLMESAFEKKQAEVQSMMDKRFSELSTNQLLRKNNPALQDPAVKPLVDTIAARLRKQFPNAAPEDIAQHAQDYFVKMAKNIADNTPKEQDLEAPGKQSSPFETKDGGFDWGKYAESDSL